MVFLFTVLQIKDETFLEDISMILTTGRCQTSSQLMRMQIYSRECRLAI